MLIALHLPTLVQLTVSVLVLRNLWVVRDVWVVVLPWSMLLMDRLTLIHYMPNNARFPVSIFPHHANLRIVALRPYLLYLAKEYVALRVRYHQILAYVLIAKRFHFARIYVRDVRLVGKVICRYVTRLKTFENG